MSEPLRRCRGLVGLVFGHKFRPRYDTEVLVPESAVSKASEAWPKMVECAARMPFRSSVETHTHDVCVRCGLVSPAPPKAQPQERSVIRRRAEIYREALSLKETPAAPAIPSPAAPPAPKIVVVPARSAFSVSVASAPNPVQAVPHPKR